MDRFLYDIGLRHERVKMEFTATVSFFFDSRRLKLSLVK